MPKNNIVRIGDYQPKASDVFFFDNNIWMFLFCPLGNYQLKRQQAYSNFFQLLLSRQLPIFVNSLVLSEFSNRYLRLDFDLANKGSATYLNYKKDYVGSPRFINTVQDLKKAMTQILSVCQRCSDEFNSINVADILTLFQKIGFNDSYYLHFAKKKNWIILTDDSDFSNANIPDIGITILTFIPR
jgi:predicted nucleic acid-binding protein